MHQLLETIKECARLRTFRDTTKVQRQRTDCFRRVLTDVKSGNLDVNLSTLNLGYVVEHRIQKSRVAWWVCRFEQRKANILL